MHTPCLFHKNDLVVFNKPLKYILCDFGIGPFRVESIEVLEKPECTRGVGKKHIDILNYRNLEPAKAILFAERILKTIPRHLPGCPCAIDPYMGIGGFGFITISDPKGNVFRRNGEPAKFISGWFTKLNQN